MRHDESAVLAWARAQGLLPEEPLGPQPMRAFPAMPDYGPREPDPEPPTMAPQPMGGGAGLSGLMAALSQFQAPPLPPMRRGEKRGGERFLYSLLSSLPQGAVASWLAQQQREGVTREETNKAIARIAARDLAKHRWESERQVARIGAVREERKEQIAERRHRETLAAKPTLEEEIGRTEALAEARARGAAKGKPVPTPKTPPEAALPALVKGRLKLAEDRLKRAYGFAYQLAAPDPYTGQARYQGAVEEHPEVQAAWANYQQQIRAGYLGAMRAASTEQEAARIVQQVQAFFPWLAASPSFKRVTGDALRGFERRSAPSAR